MCIRDRDRAAALVAKRAAGQFVQHFPEFEAAGKGLYLWSETQGSGKTTLAAGIGNALIRHCKRQVRYIGSIELLNAIRSSFRSRDEQPKLLDEASEFKVLILDDLGAERPTDWVQEQFYELMNARMTRKLVTIITSNNGPDDLSLDARTRSRIKALTMPIHLPEEDVRSQISVGVNDGLAELLYGPEDGGHQRPI